MTIWKSQGIWFEVKKNVEKSVSYGLGLRIPGKPGTVKGCFPGNGLCTLLSVCGKVLESFKIAVEVLEDIGNIFKIISKTALRTIRYNMLVY